MAIDDERPALYLLTDTLQELCPQDEIVSFNSVEEFEEYPDKSEFDVAFLDIELGAVNGIQLAFELKKHAPLCNIIFVTSYPEYGLEAYQTRPSGYVMKPYEAEDIRKELENLRNPVTRTGDWDGRLKVTTFGRFAVYCKEGVPLRFSRALSREIFAYLIDRNGFPVTSKDIAREVLEETFDKNVSKKVSKAIAILMEELDKAGFKEVLIRQNRQIRIDKSKVYCDLYEALNGKTEIVNLYRGEYLPEYSWAEVSDAIGILKRSV